MSVALIVVYLFYFYSHLISLWSSLLFGTSCCDVPDCLFLFPLLYGFIHLSCFQRLASIYVSTMVLD
jgi:hypothetical protein